MPTFVHMDEFPAVPDATGWGVGVTESGELRDKTRDVSASDGSVGWQMSIGFTK